MCKFVAYSHQPHPPRQQHGHHPRLDLPCLDQFPFQRGDFGVHIARDLFYFFLRSLVTNTTINVEIDNAAFNERKISRAVINGERLNVVTGESRV